MSAQGSESGIWPFLFWPNLPTILLMSMRLMGSTFLACLALTGCNYVGQNNPPRSSRYQRFIPIPREGAPVGMPWSGAFALDTKTGQLCWTYKGMTNNSNTQWPNLPDCASLYHGNPD